MIRIKHSIKLKELEKFGFKKNNATCDYFKGVIVIQHSTSEIYFEDGKDGWCYTAYLDDIYDLIENNLIEQYDI